MLELVNLLTALAYLVAGALFIVLRAPLARLHHRLLSRRAPEEWPPLSLRFARIFYASMGAFFTFAMVGLLAYQFATGDGSGVIETRSDPTLFGALVLALVGAATMALSGPLAFVSLQMLGAFGRPSLPDESKTLTSIRVVWLSFGTLLAVFGTAVTFALS